MDYLITNGVLGSVLVLLAVVIWRKALLMGAEKEGLKASVTLLAAAFYFMGAFELLLPYFVMIYIGVGPLPALLMMFFPFVVFFLAIWAVARRKPTS